MTALKNVTESPLNPVVIQISKADIIAQNVDRVTDILNSFIPGLAERNRNRVRIEVLGYGDDKRELFDIPEVRLYFQKLFDAVNGAFYWLDSSSYMLIFWGLMLLTPVRSDGKVGLLPEDMQKYLMWGYIKLNAFCKENSLSPEPSTAAISSAVSSFWE